MGRLNSKNLDCSPYSHNFNMVNTEKEENLFVKKICMKMRHNLIWELLMPVLCHAQAILSFRQTRLLCYCYADRIIQYTSLTPQYQHIITRKTYCHPCLAHHHITTTVAECENITRTLQNQVNIRCQNVEVICKLYILYMAQNFRI